MSNCLMNALAICLSFSFFISFYSYSFSTFYSSSSFSSSSSSSSSFSWTFNSPSTLTPLFTLLSICFQSEIYCHGLCPCGGCNVTSKKGLDLSLDKLREFVVGKETGQSDHGKPNETSQDFIRNVKFIKHVQK